MTTEHDMAVAIATEIGKQVPVKSVYDDTTSPAAKQIGKTLEDIVKVVRLVGFPIQWLAVQQDRYRNFIEKSAQQVPTENRVLPPPQLFGQILEGIKYEIVENEITDMFSVLLSRAMDVENQELAHPSFPYIIRQLSPSQALTVKRLFKSGSIQYARVVDHNNDVKFEFYGEDITLPLAKEDVQFHLSHLKHLGIVVGPIVFSTAKMREGPERERQLQTYKLTDFGAAFARACIGEH